MTDSPLVPHDANGNHPGLIGRGDCVSGLPAAEKRGCTGTPVHEFDLPGDWGQGETDIFEVGEESTLLDPSKHSCNTEDYAVDCRLPDKDLPPPEWQVQPLSIAESSFWFSGCKRERKSVYEALILAGCRKALHRYVNCGSCTRVLYQGRIGDQHAFRVVAFGCRCRYCPRCARNRSNLIGRNVRRFLAGNDRNLKFVTLTLRHNKTGLRDQLKRLTSCFNNMKRRDWWKSKVKGGMMFTEVKLSKAGLWHVHAHLIVDAKYMPQHELSSEWLAVTGDSPIVDVRLIKNAEAAASYVAKYGSKSFDAGLINQPARLAEVMTALKGSRLCTTFGEWRGKKLTSPDKNEDDGDWQDLGSLEKFRESEQFSLFTEMHPDLALRIDKCLRPKRLSG